MQNDLDIIYEIFQHKIYLDTEALKEKVAQIRNATFATGILVELVCKCEKYQVDPAPIRDIFYNEGYSVLDPLESHTEYMHAIIADPRSPLEDFLYSDIGDLTEHQPFLDWAMNLNEKELAIVEKYCVDREHYEVIYFIMGYRKGELY